MVKKDRRGRSIAEILQAFLLQQSRIPGTVLPTQSFIALAPVVFFFCLSIPWFDAIFRIAPYIIDRIRGAGSIMKKAQVIFLLIGFMFMLSAGKASALSHWSQNEFMTAESLDPGMTQTGIIFALGDHFRSYYPQVRYGLGAMMELGVKFGVISAKIDSGDDLGALVGVDLKYQLVKETEGIPVDLSVDLGFDNIIIKSKNASELTFATVVSKGIPLTDRGYKLTPYGGLVLSALYGSLPDKRDTYVNAFAGLEWKVSQKFMFLLEIKAGDSTVGGAGIRFEY
jgi:hypothetical protein